jgi:DNA-binding GntR family transcriptional regulator
MMEDFVVGARTVNHLAYDRLSAMILTGMLRPGVRLDERLLAERMGISRTPLRGAIGQLASDGLVEHRPYQGNFVRTFTSKQIEDLYTVRKNLEGLAIRLAAPKLPGAGLDELRQTIDRCRKALDQGDIEEFEQTDRDFHAIILRFSENETLVESLKRLGLRIQLLRHMANRVPHLPEVTVNEREVILQALERGDVEGAVVGMDQHIEGAQRAVLNQISSE